MSRPWRRSSLRALSILVLVLGLVAGGYLSTDRHDQRNASAQQAISLAAAHRPDPTVADLAAIDAAQKSAQARAVASAQAAASQAASAEAKARQRAATEASRSKTTGGSVGPIPTSCNSYTGNRAIGCTLVLAAGLSLTQMACLDKMWTHESNWRTTAENASSGSYGIPQSLPGSKMAAFGSDWKTNPVTQIKWGLSYIKNRYGTPCDAWSFWQTHNFY